MFTFNKKNLTQGFTLIELLVVVSVVGVLAAVMVRVMNINRTRNYAEDGVRMANVSKIAQGIEAFLAAEGRLPATDPTTFNPLRGPDAASLGFYLSSWPIPTVYGPGSANYRYAVIENSTICVSVPQTSELGTNDFFYKYISPWSATLTGGRAECAGTVVLCNSTSSSCSGDMFDNDLGNCVDLRNQPC